jgi:hypothetical protein
LSAVDPQLKPRRFAIPELSGRAVFWWASVFAGLSFVVTDVSGSSLPIHPYSRVAMGAGMLLVSAVGLLDHYSVVNVRLLWSPRRTQIRERIDAYCKKGEELHVRLATDPAIRPGDTHRVVTDIWVNPVADYLRGTLGERGARYFLSILHEAAPDQVSVRQFGYAKALAMARIRVRLQRLRQITAGL